MAIEASSDRAICSRCGVSYSRLKGYFPVSYASQHKGTQHIPVCKECIDTMYNAYLAQCGDPKNAVRQMCRKLDIYWSEDLYKVTVLKNTPRTMMTQYLRKLTGVTYAGKSYDDTLMEEGKLWDFIQSDDNLDECQESDEIDSSDREEENDIPEEVIAFWGDEYSPQTYKKLERWRAYYMSKLQLPADADLDIGTEGLIRQACNLELAIARETAAGQNTDKLINTLNTVYGSLNFKPTQKHSADEEAELSNTPLGVWLYRYENKRPLPEIDDSLKDVHKIKKYIFTWMGHLCKMMGKKNGYTKLYEEEIENLRVERPDFEDESDEDLMIASYSNDGDGDE